MTGVMPQPDPRTVEVSPKVSFVYTFTLCVRLGCSFQPSRRHAPSHGREVLSLTQGPKPPRPTPHESRLELTTPFAEFELGMEMEVGRLHHYSGSVSDISGHPVGEGGESRDKAVDPNCR